MRARVLTDDLTLTPGVPGTALIEVTNTLTVIDGIAASARSGEGLAVSYAPALLALFPGAIGQIAVTLTAGTHFPAGSSDLVVELTSSVDPDERMEIPLTIAVTPAPALTLAVDPPARRHRHRAAYRVDCTNRGNTVLDIDLAVGDPGRTLTVRVVPATIRLEPGSTGSVQLRVKGRRHLLGSDRRHRVAILARAGDTETDTSAAFRQAPLIPTGARTSMVLAAIVAMWAAIFAVAMSRANSNDSLTKQVPPSFYASLSAGQVHTAAFGVLGRPGLLASASSGDLPVGVVPKNGVVIGVGGTIDGTVTASSTSAGIGRITVEAVRDTSGGPVLVSSAATASDGTYSLVGLLPGTYKLQFSAPGYQDVWYPNVGSESAASPVSVTVQATTSGIDATISGDPGSITGTVDTGQSPSPPVTVTVVSEQGNGQPIATVTTDSSGNYSVPGLPAPGIYDLSFSAPGYQVGTDTEVISGGEAHIANTVTMSAGTGVLAGVVTDGKNPLGGVSITANANGQTVTSATPTSGGVGQFSIPNLTTPATYLLTFTDPGYGTDTVAEHLGPGQSLTNLSIVLSGGAGQVSGQVETPTGTPLGGVTVTVDNISPPTSTHTLTAGSVGSYLLSGLATPGTYTVTFSLAGYQPQTLAVTLGSSGSASSENATLAPLSGTITGTVTAAATSGSSSTTTGTTASTPGKPLSGVTVTITDGSTTRTTTTTSSPDGGFTLSGLPSSSYSVTFTLAGYQPTTVLVHLEPGQTADASTTMTPVTS